MSVCMHACVDVYGLLLATVGHLDAALCRPLVAWLCFVRETGHAGDAWQRAGECAWWAQRSAQCLQRVGAGHQLVNSPLLGHTWGEKETQKSKGNREDTRHRERESALRFMDAGYWLVGSKYPTKDNKWGTDSAIGRLYSCDYVNHQPVYGPAELRASFWPFKKKNQDVHA